MRKSGCALSPSSSGPPAGRSEEHTSELQSHSDLVCRLLLEKKKIEFIDKNLSEIFAFAQCDEQNHELFERRDILFETAGGARDSECLHRYMQSVQQSHSATI